MPPAPATPPHIRDVRAADAESGYTHHAVHNVPLARLVFVPQHDGRLHRCAIDGNEVGYNVASRSEKSEGEHGSPPHDERTDASIPGGGDEGSRPKLDFSHLGKRIGG